MLHPKDPRTREALKTLALCAGAVVLVAGSAAAGCVEDPVALPGSASTSGDTPPSTGENHGEEMFNALQSELVGACGSCHQAGGIADTPFLAGPDVYKSILSWPGIVTKDYTQSSLLTHAVVGGGHSGTNLDSDDLRDSLLPKVTAWLQEEAKGIVEGTQEVGPSIEPFTPIIGFNAVYLDSLGDAYKGMAVTFNADELTSTTLILDQLEVHATVEMGVHMVHPLFVVYPKGIEADPDPTDSFSNVDQYFDVGEAGELGPGAVILTNWRDAAKLSVAFEVLEPYSSLAGGDGGPGSGGGCKDIDSFTANAQGAFQGNCFNCHGGGNAAAKGAVDMSALQSDPAAACGQIRNRVSPNDPPNSQIFLTTDPGMNAAHPFKFGGDGNAFNQFKSQVSVWVNAEK